MICNCISSSKFKTPICSIIYTLFFTLLFVHASITPATAVHPGENGVVAVSWNNFIYTIDPSNPTERIPIAFGVDPSFSPDGRLMVYTGSGNEITIREVDPDDSSRYINPQVIYDLNGPTVPSPGITPTFSPDGQRVGFAGNGGINIVDINEPNVLQLFIDIPAFHPEWSPDGSTFVFALRGLLETFNVYSVSSSGGTETQLTEADTWPVSSCADVDCGDDPTLGCIGGICSNRCSSTEPCGGEEICDSGRCRPNVNTSAKYPQFTPSGSAIIFQAARGNFFNDDEFKGLGRVGPGGGGWSEISNIQTLNHGISPDGTKIAFSGEALEDDDRNNVYISSIGGGAGTLLHSFPVNFIIQGIAWQPSPEQLQLRVVAIPEETTTDGGVAIQLLIKNNGNETLSNITISGEVSLVPEGILELSDGPIPESISSLAPGEEREIQLDYFSLANGEVEISVKVQGEASDSTIIESSEKSATVTVTPGAGFTQIRLAPDIIDVGTKAIVKFDFQNTASETADTVTPPSNLQFQSISGGEVTQISGPLPAEATDIPPEGEVSFYYLIEGVSRGQSKPIGKITYQIGDTTFETPDASPRDPLDIGPLLKAELASEISVIKEGEEFEVSVAVSRRDTNLDRVEDAPFDDPRPIFSNLELEPTFEPSEGLTIEATKVVVTNTILEVLYEGELPPPPVESFGPGDRLTFTYTLEGDLDVELDEAVSFNVSSIVTWDVDAEEETETARCDFEEDNVPSNCNGGTNLEIDVGPGDSCIVKVEDESPPLIFFESFSTLATANGDPVAVCGSGSGQCSIITEELEERITLTSATESSRDTVKNVGQEVILKAAIELPEGFSEEDIESVEWEIGGDSIDFYKDFSAYRRMSLAEGRTAFLFEPGPNGPDRTFTKTPADTDWEKLAFLWKNTGDHDVTVKVTLKKDDEERVCDDTATFEVERNSDDFKRTAEKLYSSCCEMAVDPEDPNGGERQRIAFLHETLHNQDDSQVVFPGDSWITFHRVIVESFNRWREFFGYPTIGYYDGSVPIPTSENGFTLNEPTRVSGAPKCNFSWDSPDALCPLSPWFNVSGRTDNQGILIARTEQDLNSPASCKFANGAIVPLGQTRLGDFQDNISLGCVLSKTWHNNMHETISGVMLATFQSVFGPSFWRMHNFLTGAEIGGAPGPIVSLPVRSRLFGPSTVFAQSAPQELSVFAAWEQNQAEGPPGVSLYLPRKNSPVPRIQLVIVQFWEEVTGIVPELVEVGGSPATTVIKDGPFYIFSGFEQPPFGDTVIEVLSGDVVDTDGNLFQGFSWLVPVEEDSDGDGFSDSIDNCVDIPNPTQQNSDRVTRFLSGGDGENKTRFVDEGDLLGDACDPDDDNDGISDEDELAQGSDPLSFNSPDGCPSDPNKTEPGLCGCGTPDTDTDGDDFVDCGDVCPTDGNKTISAGICGCGNPETDADGDTVPVCLDSCDSDPLKTEPGKCGCGIPDTDSNGDGVPECGFQDGSECLPGEECIFGALPNVACAYANNFLNHVNIATVVNLSDSELEATVVYREGLGGKELGRFRAKIGAMLRQDIIINDLGVEPDTVGTVCIVTPEGSEWSGGISIYKPTGSDTAFGDSFDYALYYPFAAPVIGETTLPINTYHIGVNSTDTVANWVSIADGVPGDGRGVSGKLHFESAEGDNISTISVNIQDGGRSDFSGHDAIAGESNADSTGTARFEPEDDGAPYAINLTRYFYNCGGGASCNSFYTAFSIPHRPATNAETVAIVSTEPNVISIAEVYNASSSPAFNTFTLYGEAGVQSDSQNFGIPARGSQHFVLGANDDLVAAGAPSTVQTPADRDQISAISVYYKLDSSGMLQYGYSTPFVGTTSTTQLSEFNSFISQRNTPVVSNFTNEELKINVKGLTFDNTMFLNTEITLAPNESTVVEAEFPENSYGTIVAESNKAGFVLSNKVLREGEYMLEFLGKD